MPFGLLEDGKLRDPLGSELFMCGRGWFAPDEWEAGVSLRGDRGGALVVVGLGHRQSVSD
jgi:hypothetical protein